MRLTISAILLLVGSTVTAFAPPAQRCNRPNNNGFAVYSSPHIALAMSEAATMADSGKPPASSNSDMNIADVEIPTRLPTDVGMDYVPLATMLATGQLAEADQVRQWMIKGDSMPFLFRASWIHLFLSYWWHTLYVKRFHCRDLRAHLTNLEISLFAKTNHNWTVYQGRSCRPRWIQGEGSGLCLLHWGEAHSIHGPCYHWTPVEQILWRKVWLLCPKSKSHQYTHHASNMCSVTTSCWHRHLAGQFMLSFLTKIPAPSVTLHILWFFHRKSTDKARRTLRCSARKSDGIRRTVMWSARSAGLVHRNLSMTWRRRRRATCRWRVHWGEPRWSSNFWVTPFGTMRSGKMNLSDKV